MILTILFWMAIVFLLYIICTKFFIFSVAFDVAHEQEMENLFGDIERLLHVRSDRKTTVKQQLDGKKYVLFFAPMFKFLGFLSEKTSFSSRFYLNLITIILVVFSVYSLFQPVSESKYVLKYDYVIQEKTESKFLMDRDPQKYKTTFFLKKEKINMFNEDNTISVLSDNKLQIKSEEDLVLKKHSNVFGWTVYLSY